jgi:hypothetical protein
MGEGVWDIASNTCRSLDIDGLYSPPRDVVVRDTRKRHHVVASCSRREEDSVSSVTVDMSLLMLRQSRSLFIIKHVMTPASVLVQVARIAFNCSLKPRGVQHPSKVKRVRVVDYRLPKFVRRRSTMRCTIDKPTPVFHTPAS